MKTFDLAEIRKFANRLDASMDRCDNSEGMECANVDDTLLHYARLCRQFHGQVRQWGRAVFAGLAEFDPEVERVLLEQGKRLLQNAMETLAHAKEVEDDCYILDGKCKLEAALLGLHQQLCGWVTPKLAIGPSARQRLDASATEEMRKRVESLSPLPADWAPADPRQLMQYKKVRNSS